MSLTVPYIVTLETRMVAEAFRNVIDRSIGSDWSAGAGGGARLSSADRSADNGWCLRQRHCLRTLDEHTKKDNKTTIRSLTDSNLRSNEETDKLHVSRVIVNIFIRSTSEYTRRDVETHGPSKRRSDRRAESSEGIRN